MTEPHWLVKDFHVLYRAAKAFSDACAGKGDGKPYLPHKDLEAQLERLRPAFEACEAERRGAPGRLTEAERRALNALHRWLHSPAGDGALTEEAQDYHEQVEVECPEECVRLETEERLAWGQARRGEVET